MQRQTSSGHRLSTRLGFGLGSDWQNCREPLDIYDMLIIAVMPSLLGLLVPTMTDPRVGRGFAICNRDFDPFASPRPRAVRHNADLRMPPAAVILGRKQGARTRANEDRSNGRAGATCAGETGEGSCRVFDGSRLRLFRLVSVRASKKVENNSQAFEIFGAPNGNRTRVFAVKGRFASFRNVMDVGKRSVGSRMLLH